MTARFKASRVFAVFSLAAVLAALSPYPAAAVRVGGGGGGGSSNGGGSGESGGGFAALVAMPEMAATGALKKAIPAMVQKIQGKIRSLQADINKRENEINALGNGGLTRGKLQYIQREERAIAAEKSNIQKLEATKAQLQATLKKLTAALSSGVQPSGGGSGPTANPRMSGKIRQLELMDRNSAGGSLPSVTPNMYGNSGNPGSNISYEKHILAVERARRMGNGFYQPPSPPIKPAAASSGPSTQQQIQRLQADINSKNAQIGKLAKEHNGALTAGTARVIGADSRAIAADKAKLAQLNMLNGPLAPVERNIQSLQADINAKNSEIGKLAKEHNGALTAGTAKLIGQDSQAIAADTAKLAQLKMLSVKPGTDPIPLTVNFTQEMLPYALEVAAKTGIPARFWLAKWGLDSGWGRSPGSRFGNNFDGFSAGSFKSPQAFAQAAISYYNQPWFNGARAAAKANPNNLVAIGNALNPAYGAEIAGARGTASLVPMVNVPAGGGGPSSSSPGGASNPTAGSSRPAAGGGSSGMTRQEIQAKIKGLQAEVSAKRHDATMITRKINNAYEYHLSKAQMHKLWLQREQDYAAVNQGQASITQFRNAEKNAPSGGGSSPNGGPNQSLLKSLQDQINKLQADITAKYHDARMCTRKMDNAFEYNLTDSDIKKLQRQRTRDYEIANSDKSQISDLENQEKMLRSN